MPVDESALRAAFSEDQAGALPLLADLGARRLQALQVETRLEERGAQLQQVLPARVVIERARGMLAERHGVSPEVASNCCVTTPERATAMREVAEEVVTGELDL